MSIYGDLCECEPNAERPCVHAHTEALEALAVIERWHDDSPHGGAFRRCQDAPCRDLRVAWDVE